jgi:hypothetical protein
LGKFSDGVGAGGVDGVLRECGRQDQSQGLRACSDQSHFRGGGSHSVGRSGDFVIACNKIRYVIEASGIGLRLDRLTRGRILDGDLGVGDNSSGEVGDCARESGLSILCAEQIGGLHTDQYNSKEQLRLFRIHCGVSF